MAGAILPSGPGGQPRAWGADHQRLHRHLLRQPALLPRDAPLLLAVSGGQDSMAMGGLLRDLQPLHGWTLHLWHGDHDWRPEAGRQAAELAAWAERQQLPLRVERWPRTEGGGNREQQARLWRYGCLEREARRLGCGHVLTAHTASDRAETVLLHLARGSHRRGLSGLRSNLPLAALLAGERGGDPGEDSGLRLVRPLQLFSRQDTARLCRQWGWPVWVDPTNGDLSLSRNRIRAHVLPELEALHPGAARRISAQAERLAAELDQQQELLDIALSSLTAGPGQLNRDALLGLSIANRRSLLQRWLELERGSGLQSRTLDDLLTRLPRQRGPGQLDLGGGWQLHWQGSRLTLLPPLPPPAAGHG